jgi:hypothetical protein
MGNIMFSKHLKRISAKNIDLCGKAYLFMKMTAFFLDELIFHESR